VSDEDKNRKKSPKEETTIDIPSSLTSDEDKNENETIVDIPSSSTSNEDKKRKQSPKEDQNKKETRVDIPTPSPPDGNWKTIDMEILYDKEKCDLNKYDLDTVYKILE